MNVETERKNEIKRYVHRALLCNKQKAICSFFTDQHRKNKTKAKKIIDKTKSLSLTEALKLLSVCDKKVAYYFAVSPSSITSQYFTVFYAERDSTTV